MTGLRRLVLNLSVSALALVLVPFAAARTLPQDLPLVEVPTLVSPAAPISEEFAVLLSGDGGWAAIDKDISAGLAARGVPVVGLNTLKYFWKKRLPEAAAADLERIIRGYSAVWKRPKVLLIGYSSGADTLPFLYTRLSADVRDQVRTVSLLGLSDTATFEFHLANWLPGTSDDGRPTVPEIERMRGTAVLCIFGAGDKESACPHAASAGVKAVALGDGHHFGGEYA